MDQNTLVQSSSDVKLEPSTIELNEPVNVKSETSAIKLEPSTVKVESPAANSGCLKYSGPQPRSSERYAYNHQGDHVSNALAILRNHAMHKDELTDSRRFSYCKSKKKRWQKGAKILMDRCDYIESLRHDRRNNAIIARELNRSTRQLGVFFNPDLTVSPSFSLGNFKGRDALFGLVGQKVSIAKKPKNF